MAHGCHQLMQPGIGSLSQAKLMPKGFLITSAAFKIYLLKVIIFNLSSLGFFSIKAHMKSEVEYYF